MECALQKWKFRLRLCDANWRSHFSLFRSFSGWHSVFFFAAWFRVWGSFRIGAAGSGVHQGAAWMLQVTRCSCSPLLLLTCRFWKRVTRFYDTLYKLYLHYISVWFSMIHFIQLLRSHCGNMSIISAYACHLAKATLIKHDLAIQLLSAMLIHCFWSQNQEMLGTKRNRRFMEQHFEGGRPKSFHRFGDHYSWQSGTLAMLSEWPECIWRLQMCCWALCQ